MRLVADKKVAEPRNSVLIRRLAVALAEYEGAPVMQRHHDGRVSVIEKAPRRI